MKFIPVEKNAVFILEKTFNFMLMKGHKEFYHSLYNLFVIKKFNPLMLNVPKWYDTLLKSCSICCKIFKVSLTILGHYALKG